MLMPKSSLRTSSSRQKPEPEVGKDTLGFMLLFPFYIHTSDSSNTIFPMSMDTQAFIGLWQCHLVGTNKATMADPIFHRLDH